MDQTSNNNKLGNNDLTPVSGMFQLSPDFPPPVALFSHLSIKETNGDRMVKALWITVALSVGLILGSTIYDLIMFGHAN